MNPNALNRAVSMPERAAAPDLFATWLRDHATRLSHLGPDAPLDDLEPLRDAVAGARVVAVGENSHFIEEFALLRHRVLRFLVERCGFTLFAAEYGFSEGFRLDEWARGAGHDADLHAHTAAAVPLGLEEPLRRLRRHNRTAARPVEFAGVDIPAAGGSLLPALEPVAAYLREADPEALPFVETAARIAERFAGHSAAVGAPAWARLAPADQDALSAALLRAVIRLRAVEPTCVARAGRRSYDIALRRLEAACHGDYGMRAMSDLFAGRGLTADTSARDAFMAESVRWHLDRAAPGTRMVLVAHNAHIQRTPVVHAGGVTTLPMGRYLHETLGEEYFALALTSTSGHAAEMPLDPDAKFGFTIGETELAPPEPGSVEAAFAAAGLGLALADLRHAPPVPPGHAPDRIRLQSGYLRTPVRTAFDGVLNVPVSTVSRHPDL
ncbi:erythromycin esterase family protein [Marinactinospora rubrisoli]|uniref:Erythromycin esterase family protein n=1 Tax=Marinactinospora rubrisoli TaxID=2715399 RepID=A0ABW2KER4_9ACTN